MAVSGVGDRSPGTISGRGRGIGIVPAVPTELAASKRAVRQRKLVVMFQRAAKFWRTYLRQELWNMGGHFDISSRSGNFECRLIDIRTCPHLQRFRPGSRFWCRKSCPSLPEWGLGGRPAQTPVSIRKRRVLLHFGRCLLKGAFGLKAYRADLGEAAGALLPAASAPLT